MKQTFKNTPCCRTCGRYSFLNPACVEKHKLVPPETKIKSPKQRKPRFDSDDEWSDDDSNLSTPSPTALPTRPAPPRRPAPAPQPPAPQPPTPQPPTPQPPTPPTASPRRPAPAPQPPAPPTAHPAPPPDEHQPLPFDGEPYLRVHKTKEDMNNYAAGKYSIHKIAFESGVKCVIVNSGMGSGKSHASIDMILADRAAHPGVNRRYLFVCARVQQGFSLMSALQKIDAKLYSNEDLKGAN